MVSKSQLRLLLIVACSLLGRVTAAEEVTCPTGCRCNADRSAYCYRVSLDNLTHSFNSHIQYFGLYNANQTVLRNYTFQNLGMRSMTSLRLSGNNIEQIESAAFEGLQELTTLYLPNNKIHDLHPDTFPGNLLYLDLTSNPLIIPNTTTFLNIPMLSNLVIEFSSRPIPEIPDKMFIGMKMIRNIRLRHNYINTISHKAFATLRKLQELDLSRNEIDLIHGDTFKYNTELEFINLERNNLVVPGHSILDAPALKKLILSSNSMKVLHELSFDKLRNLETLIMRECSLETAQVETFNLLRNLKYLDLSHNSLTHIHPDAFIEHLKLRSITLNYNRLNLTTPFISVPKLEQLQIRSCNISDIHLDTFQNMQMLKFIDIANNQIENVDEELFYNLQRLSSVDLSGNPFACTCRKKDLTHWALAHFIRVSSTCMKDNRPVVVKC